MEIRQAVQAGRVQEAVERVNDLNPEILEEKQDLFFHLQQQQLIELIRQSKVGGWLPRGEGEGLPVCAVRAGCG